MPLIVLTDPATDTVLVTGERAARHKLSLAGATKTDALPRDLPHSVRTLNTEQLHDAGVTSLSGALDLTRPAGRSATRSTPAVTTWRAPFNRFLGEPGDGRLTVQSLGQSLLVQHVLAEGWSLQGGAAYRDSSLQGFSSDANDLLADGHTLRRQHRYRDWSALDHSARIELLSKASLLGIRHRAAANEQQNRRAVPVRQRPARLPAAQSRSHEMGVKLETPGSLVGTLAVYRIDQEHVRTPNPANTGFSIPAGAAASKGVALDVAGRLRKGLALSAAYAYTDARATFFRQRQRGDRVDLAATRPALFFTRLREPDAMQGGRRAAMRAGYGSQTLHVFIGRYLAS